MVKKTKKIFFVEIKDVLRDNHILLPKNNKNILEKNNRPYYAVVTISKSYSAFIPLRTNLRHKYGFITKQSFNPINNQHTISGLDYTKALLFKTENMSQYTKNVNVIIDNDSFTKINKSEKRIHHEFKQFLKKDFLPLVDKDISKMNTKEKNLYTFSALQYFKDATHSIKKEQQENRAKKNNSLHKTTDQKISKVPHKERQTQTKRPILEQIQQAEHKSVQKNQNKPSDRTTRRRDLEK